MRTSLPWPLPGKNRSVVVLTEEDLLEAGLVGKACSFPRIVIDSRQVLSGDLFACLKGDLTDGHLFARDAVHNGAAGLLCLNSSVAALRESLKGEHDIAILSSEDVVASLQALGRIRRRSFAGTVIAIVGSNGKTSTKEILASLLRSLTGADRTFATPGNLNNHLGLPLSLCALPDEARFAVLELGMNHPGEISLLAKIARPHHCLVPSIGLEHMEFFKDLEEVAAAELEILEGLESGGTIVYPAGAPGLARLHAHAASRTRSIHPIHIEEFHLQHEGDDSVTETGSAGRYRDGAIHFAGQVFSTGEYRGEAMASNILGSLVLLRHILSGADARDLDSRLSHACAALRPVAKGRFRMEEIGGTILVDDSYNANPDSFRQSLRSLREVLPGGRLLCLAGHMAELGHFSSEGHEAVGHHLLASGFEGLLVCGHEDVRRMAATWQGARPSNRPAIEEIKYFEDSESLSTYIREHPDVVRGWDGILVKGSRSARMEKVLPAVRQALGIGSPDTAK